MKREELLSIIKLLTAFAEGKVLQWQYKRGPQLPTGIKSNPWNDVNPETFHMTLLDDEALNFRIKPEPRIIIYLERNYANYGWAQWASWGSEPSQPTLEARKHECIKWYASNQSESFQVVEAKTKFRVVRFVEQLDQ